MKTDEPLKGTIKFGTERQIRMKTEYKTITSDVLVVGGSGAAVMSAVSAVKENVSVTLVCKGKVGKSGNAIMIGGSFGVDGESARDICGEPDANSEYTKEKLFHKLIASSFGLGDQEIEKHFVEEGPPAVRECLDWVKESKQVFKFIPQSSSWRTSGVAFGRALRQGMSDHPEVSVYEDNMIVDLLTNGGKVCGALGLDVYTGELTEFRAKSVILATGGFQPFSLKNSISDMTGDGIAMALRAGADVTDMEFLLFIGTIIEPGYAHGSILPYLMSIPSMFPMRPKVTDLGGEELVFPSDSRYKVKASDNKVNKVLMAYFYGRGVFDKIDQYGNAFYYDYSAYSDEEIRQTFRNFAENQRFWNGKDRYHGINLQQLAQDIIDNKKRLKVGLGNEYSMGGIIVKPDFSTRVPGLFAAGEVTGGTFGAFRSGDGLTEMLAHGVTAGISAAKYAKENSLPESNDIENKIGRLTAPFHNKEGISPIETCKKLEAICDRGFNFFRSGERLQEAYDEIVSLGGSLNSMYIPTDDMRYNLELIHSVIARNLALCAEIGIYCALNRKESRGTHFRTDYPEVNNQKYLFNWTAEIKNGVIEYGKKQPNTKYIALDKTNYPSVPECIVKTILEG